MVAPSGKTLSAAELAQLEHNFASDPASEAYRPLAEAYLGMGRYMEAMVVCKKGVKAHPNETAPRLLLARVYADQGKDKKALEELTGALQVAPTDKSVLRMAGALFLKSGDAEAGRVNLLKAYEADPQDPDTLAQMQAWKIEPPRAAPAAPAPVAAVVTEPEVETMPPPRAAAGNGAPAGQATAAAPRAQPQASQARQVARAAPQVVRGSGVYETQENDIPSRRRSTGMRTVFMVLAAMLPISAAVYFFVGQQVAKKNREINGLLRKASEELKHDSYTHYVAATEAADKAADLDDGNYQAHAFSAYAWAVLWGEHGGGKVRLEEAREHAEAHLAKAKKSKDWTTYTYAAEALVSFYAGKIGEAKTTLEGHVKKLESENRQAALLYVTLGIILIETGDLESARDRLEKARAGASDDARVFASLGRLHRLRGSDAEAGLQYATGLRFEKDHPDSKLGSALLFLDQPDPGPRYALAAKQIRDVLDAQPPVASPRQIAMANAVNALLISRVAHDLPLYVDKAFVAKLEADTGVKNDPRKAEADVAKAEAAAALDSNNPEIRYVKAKRLMWEKNYAAAIDELQKAITQDGKKPHYHYELARAFLAKGGAEKEAEEAVKRAVAAVPDSSRLLALYGEVLYRQKRIDEAQQKLEKAANDPKVKNPEARMLLASLLRDERKDAGKAGEQFEIAAKEYFRDESLAAQALYQAGIAWESKDRARAEKNFREAVMKDRDLDDAYCRLAKLVANGPDAAKSKDSIKSWATEYLRVSPKGACAGDMARFAQ